MKKFLDEIKKANGKKIEISSSEAVVKITNEKRDTYRQGGLLPNECRGNSQSVSRFLGDGSLIVEGFLITKENCCFPHMWVRYNDINIDLTTELFGNSDEVQDYYELITHLHSSSSGLNRFKSSDELSFSPEAERILDVFYEENPDCKEKYDQMNNDLHEER